MYDGRFGEIDCMVCEKVILPGDTEAFSLHNGEDLSPPANSGSWMCGADCNEEYASMYYEVYGF